MEEDKIKEQARIKVEEMKKPNLLTIIGALIIICLIVLATLFIKITKERNKCEANPFVYGAEKTAEAGLEVICSCTPLNPKYSGFYFDKDGLNIQNSIISNP